MMTRALVVLVVLTTRGHAEPSSLGIYGEPSLWLGEVWGEFRAANGFVSSTDSRLVDLRFSLGVRVGPHHGFNGRLGAAVDIINGDGTGAALGIEAQADCDLHLAGRRPRFGVER